MKLDVDATYVISAKDSNRRILTTQRLNHQNIDFLFYDATMIPEDPVKGCFTSHMTLINQLHKKGYSRALIFEDDVQFVTPLNLEIEQINLFLNQYQWTIFYLGHRPLTIGPDINGVRSCQSHDTHAYIINLKNFKYYDTQYQPSIVKGLAAIDGLYSFQPNCYCLYPMLCIQDSSLISTIENKMLTINYQLYAEKNAKNLFWSIIGQLNVLAHKNHFENSPSSGICTLIIPPMAIGLIVIYIILFCLYYYII